MNSLTKYYSDRYDILHDLYMDLRVCMILHTSSAPAETLEEVKNRLEQTKQQLEELINEEESKKETE